MWKFLILIVAVYVLYRMFTNDKRRKDSIKKDVDTTKVKAGELVQDPVCGTYISKENALTVRDNDTKYYFCSYECRDAFLKQKKALGSMDEKGDTDEKTEKSE